MSQEIWSWRDVVRTTAERIASPARALARIRPPGEKAWMGAAWGLLAATLFILALRLAYHSSGTPVLAILIGLPIEILIAGLGGGLILLANRILAALPLRYRAVLAGTLFLLFTQIFTGNFAEKFIPTLYVILTASLLGGSFSPLLRWRTSGKSPSRLVLRIVCLALGAGASVFGVSWLLRAGEDSHPSINAAAASGVSVPALDLPDPAEPGDYEVKTLFYGSGKDLRRPEYGAGVNLVTRPFDGSAFIQGWKGFEGWARRRYWGFGANAMPINGRVWYPGGDGPFPLVLIVHGNHRMQEFSDPGYEYLGKNLASHGYIVASVDENFLNGAPWYNLGVYGLQQLNGDNAARGVLLLEHLRAFRQWNGADGNPFRGRVDMERIALIGHSRGGEAIAVAAAFNRLSHYPEDASIRFDYGFNIRSLVALSTTDKQYLPGGTGIELRDVNYLALQGSNDGDVPYFMGMQQLERLKFTEGVDMFKAAVYIHRANHGQFNSVWGQHDKSAFPKSLFFNRRPLLPSPDQERIANVFVTAFLEATLRGKEGYVPLFQDYRAGSKWLPDTIYLNRYRHSGFHFTVGFSEDIDLVSTTIPGGTITGENLTVWREQPPGRQALWSTLGTRSAFLGWDDERSAVASYTITLPDPGVELGPSSLLFFALADANENPSPRGRARPRRGKSSAPRAPIDLTIELTDHAGTTARVPLSAVSLLQPQLQANVWKGWFAEPQLPGIVFKTFLFPLSKFVEANPRFDPTRVKAARFVFDRTPAGVVALDNLGFRP